LPDREWERLGCTELLEAVFAAALGPYRNHAVATKVLHLKRPLLIPILDSLVVEQIGGGERTPAIDLVLHLRAEGQRNRIALRQVQASLGRQGSPDRWSASWMFSCGLAILRRDSRH
jgi:hypothetical protein